ncbi:hypothetical protein MTR_6g015300 [Medicago truncatula]|uniref:Uncharacterized protein n=1 Tax=Medicago truncatula TaxID=3880 RepID=A0A072U7G3_MEDTR|nr:hypothetical protein MTR_6g015300 [Medicago truncatula]
MYSFHSLQETLPFVRGKIPVKKTQSLVNATFVRKNIRAEATAKALIANILPGATPLREKRGAEPLVYRQTFSLAYSLTFVCNFPAPLTRTDCISD